MVGIVVIDVRAVIFPLKLKPSACAAEARKAVFDGIGPDSDAYSRCRCGKRVFDIVLARDMERNIGKAFPFVVDVKTGIRTADGSENSPAQN